MNKGTAQLLQASETNYCTAQRHSQFVMRALSTTARIDEKGAVAVAELAGQDAARTLSLEVTR